MARCRRCYQQSVQPQLPVPVAVVGNIAVGGAGKTPVVIALVRALAQQGVVAGVVIRGYGSKNVSQPLIVDEHTEVAQSGDEARLIVWETRCPLVLGRDRVAAAKLLLASFPTVQLIISDDGLQHYRLPRQLEIAVIDADRGLGNERCLPAGPLREPPGRLQSVDRILINGRHYPPGLAGMDATLIQLQPTGWLHLRSRQVSPLQPLPWADNQKVTAVAAIGNPQRFFSTITDLGITANTLAFDDHHDFILEDFSGITDPVILMTTKDAVKCEQFAGDHWWALVVSVALPQRLIADTKILACDSGTGTSSA